MNVPSHGCGMEKAEISSVRVREWHASGSSMSEFSRGKEFTAAGLSYWVRRLSAESTPAPKSVKLARVVRKDVAARTARTSVDAGRVPAAPLRLVIEAGALLERARR